MAQFAVPTQAKEYSAKVEYFRGVDLNNSPSNVDKSRSPAAPNMIRDQVGKVRKRTGYHTLGTAPEGAKVWAVHRLGEETVVHAGEQLYRWDGGEGFEALGKMAAARSRSFIFDEKLYLLDGANYQVYDGEKLASVSESAYVPTVIISREPTGGGTTYEALNLLGRKWTETFLGTAEDTVYQLTAQELDEDEVTAEVLNAEGEWVTKTEGTDFTVDRAEGTVTFKTAPGQSPVTGMDNVKITAAKTREGYAETINGCTLAAVFGVGGAPDRVFLTGNPNKPGVDYYSGFEDPTFFPDTGYTKLSRDGAEIVGYAVLNNALAAFLKGSTDGRNVVVRTGSLDEDGEALFRISNTLIGQDAVSTDSFARTDKEPLFLTERGVYAITAEELTGEKYSQERSYYIKSAITEAKGLTAAHATVFRDFYVLALDGTLYLLDLQQKAYEKNSPYSSYQYECYYFPDIAATALWVEDNVLYFATAEGQLRAFYEDAESPASYNDDGAAIDAYWETADFDGQAFYNSKTFTGLAVRLAAAIQTGVKIFAQRRGAWDDVYDAEAKARYFDWSYIDFAKLSFSNDRTPRTLYSKIKIKKVDKVRFRLQNAELNEPFGLYAFAVMWRENGGKYKR